MSVNGLHSDTRKCRSGLNCLGCYKQHRVEKLVSRASNRFGNKIAVKPEFETVALRVTAEWHQITLHLWHNFTLVYLHCCNKHIHSMNNDYIMSLPCINERLIKNLRRLQRAVSFPSVSLSELWDVMKLEFMRNWVLHTRKPHSFS